MAPSLDPSRSAGREITGRSDTIQDGSEIRPLFFVTLPVSMTGLLIRKLSTFSAAWCLGVKVF
jgi:hypothetical protein